MTGVFVNGQAVKVQGIIMNSVEGWFQATCGLEFLVKLALVKVCIEAD